MDINNLKILKQKYRQITDLEKEKKTVTSEYLSTFNLLKRLYERIPPSKQKPLTIPVIFGRTYDENFISDFFAYILDPNKNGFGLEPLKALLGLIRPGDEIPECNDVIIHREYQLKNGRIDFLIEIDDTFVLGIENKIFASERLRQTQDYAEDIHRLFDQYDCFFAFLTPSGAKALSSEFASISYLEVLQEFRKIKYDWAVDIKKSILWEDFLTHLEVYITMNTKSKFEISEKTKLYIENFEMLNDLQMSFDNDWPNAVEYLKAKILDSLNNGEQLNEVWQARFNSNKREIWQQIYKPNWVTNDLSLHFEYWFSPNHFASNKFTFMIDVELKNAKKFLDLFDNTYPTIQHEYGAREIKYRPSNRKIAIAWKEYKYNFNPETFGDAFVSAMKEFQFLIPYIDETITKLNSK